MTTFEELGLPETVMDGIREKGYTTPTEIQAKAIPLILEGKDVIGASQTGTGKTAAFALPTISRLEGHKTTRCLILEPTRELAAQVYDSFQDYGKGTDLTYALIHGGVGYGTQTDALQNGADVVVATPGRLLDHMSKGTIKMEEISVLILDEVDRMLDMGFLPDVRRIISQIPGPRQTLFFSATMPPQIQGLADWVLKDPVEVEIGQRIKAADTVYHAFYPVSIDQRLELFEAIVEATDFDSIMVFTRTKMAADRLAANMKKKGKYHVTAMHSDIRQSERAEALKGFKEGTYDIIVATDLAARGLDISGVTHVINYNVPENAEDYVHRIGRTGRAQREGDAFTILTADEVPFAESIERLIGQKIERRRLPDFPYKYTAILDEDEPSVEKLHKMLGRTKRPKPRRRLR